MKEEKQNFQVCRYACAAQSPATQELQSFSVTLIDYLLPFFDSGRHCSLPPPTMHRGSRVKVTFLLHFVFQVHRRFWQASLETWVLLAEVCPRSMYISLIDHEIKIKINRSIVNKSTTDWMLLSWDRVCGDQFSPPSRMVSSRLIVEVRQFWGTELIASWYRIAAFAIDGVCARTVFRFHRTKN